MAITDYTDISTSIPTRIPLASLCTSSCSATAALVWDLGACLESTSAQAYTLVCPGTPGSASNVLPRYLGPLQRKVRLHTLTQTWVTTHSCQMATLSSLWAQSVWHISCCSPALAQPTSSRLRRQTPSRARTSHLQASGSACPSGTMSWTTCQSTLCSASPLSTCKSFAHLSPGPSVESKGQAKHTLTVRGTEACRGLVDW
jgi:hypothetical protein